jgi:hypothetical protein
LLPNVPAAEALSPSLPQAGAPVVLQAGKEGDEIFWAREDLDTPAIPVSEPEIDVGRIAAAGLEHLVLDVWISRAGTVLRVDVREPAGASPTLQVFVNGVVESVKSVEFEPALRNGERVASYKRLELRIR